MSEQDQTRFDPYHVWLGIPVDEQPASAYRLLGISVFENSSEVIASAADRQMAHVRTFQTGKYSSLSQKLLNEIAAAKLRLLKPAIKAAYDTELKRRLSGHSPLESKPALQAGPMAAPAPRATTLYKRAVPVPDDSSTSARARQHELQIARLRRPNDRRSAKGGEKLIGGSTPEDSFSWIAEASSKQPRIRSSLRQPGRSGRYAGLGLSLAATVVVSSVIIASRHSPTNGKTPAHTVSRDNSDTMPVTTANETRRPTFPKPVQPSDLFGSEAPQIVRDSTLGEIARTAPGLPQHEPITFSDVSSLASVPEFGATEKAAPSVNEDVGKAKRAETTSSEQSVAAESSRQRVPDDEAQNKMRCQIAECYDPAKAKAPKDKLKLANQFLAAAAKSRDETEQFVLLEYAAKLATEAGDAALMIESTEMICSQFDLDIVETTEGALNDFAKSATSSERIRSLVTASSGAIDRALESQHYQSALNVAGATVRACQRSLGKEFRKDAIQRRDFVRGLYRQQEELREARATLGVNNNDEAANLVVARWFCYVKGNWAEGLPYMAKIADPLLRRLADQELKSAPLSPEDQMALADAWWEMAKGRKGEERDALLLHAGHWYEQSLAIAVLGLTRLKVEKRLEELAQARPRQKQEHTLRAAASTNSMPARLQSD